jgi:propionyl-CoA carboxylase beta chain
MMIVVEILFRGKPAAEVEKQAKLYSDTFANPFPAAQRGFVDDVITPDITRRVICEDLEVLKKKSLSNPWKKHGNIPL